jgi:tetratricopeptide (TPR) repeat protein
MILGLVRLRHSPLIRRNRNLELLAIFLVAITFASSLRAATEPLDARIAAAGTLLERGDAPAALAAYRALLPGTTAFPRQRARTLDTLSEIETDLGDYTAAVRDANEAATLHAALGDRASQLSSINQAGLAQTYAARYAEARRSLEMALRLAVAIGATEASVEESMNLASVDFFTGRYNDAASRYEDVARILDAHRSELWVPRRRRILLANEATLDQRLGRYQQALDAYKNALADASEIRPVERAQMLANLGVVHRRLGDPIKALAAYDQARELFARDHQLDGELGVLKNRGIVLALDLGRLEEARATFADAQARAEKAGSQREALQARLYGAETSLRLGQPAIAARDFQSSWELSLTLQTVEEQWKALYGLARAELLLGDEAAGATHLAAALGVIESIRESIRIPSLKSDFFNDKREVFDALIALRLKRGASASELFALIERSHSRAWRDRLGLRTNVDLRSVQQALAPGVLLLDYWSSPAGAAVVSITSRDARVLPVTVDEAAIASMSATLASGAGATWSPLAARLSAQLLPAIPRDVQHVVVIADGTLVAVPFELLSSGPRLLIESCDVTYLPTAAMLLLPPSPIHAFAAPWSVQFRGFGDPAVSDSATSDVSGQPRLRGSADEVRAIAAELGGQSLLFLGAADQKRNLSGGASSPLLHIASHAFVDPGAMEQSRIVFSPASGGSGGADYLYLKEAYELPLNGVELAVLSACDTERGRLMRGEGVESFSRAFLAAGAKSTVTTLWRVPDATTARFMRLFYHHLQRGVPRAESLRLAKLRMMNSRGVAANPHYWAAFVLTGDGLRPVSTALRWRNVVITALLIGALLVLTLIWWRSA